MSSRFYLAREVTRRRIYDVINLNQDFVLPSDAIGGRARIVGGGISPANRRAFSDMRKSTGCRWNLDDPSRSVQGSSSGEIRSCTPFPGNELRVRLCRRRLCSSRSKKGFALSSVRGVVCPGTTCDPGSSAELRGLQGKS
jgi:hypothetical protein